MSHPVASRLPALQCTTAFLRPRVAICHFSCRQMELRYYTWQITIPHSCWDITTLSPSSFRESGI